MNWRGFKTGNILKRYIFYYVVLFLVLLSVLFLTLLNLSKITASIREQQAANDPNLQVDIKHLTEDLNRITQEDYCQNSAALTEQIVCVVGKKSDDMTQLACAQMENMKQTYCQVDQLSLLESDQLRRIRTVIIVDSNLSEEEMLLLCSMTEQGKNMIFLKLPAASLLQQEEVCDFLGIRSYDGIKTYTGFRTSKELVLGTVQEQNKVKFRAGCVTLGRQTKVLCSALVKEKDVANENLPPLIWRHIAQKGNGAVYVCNGEMMESAFGYGVISALFCDMEETYLYPVVNAYCFWIEGMPYTQNFDSEVLEQLYSRDALGFQRDLLFPQISRCSDRYGIKTTWYTFEYDSVIRSEKDDISYYKEEIQKDGSELGWINGNHLISGDPIQGIAESWQMDFSFVSDQKDAVSLPIMTEDVYQYSQQLMSTGGMIRGTGFMSMLVDISQFVNNEDLEDKEKNWADYCLELETVLGTDRQTYGWLDRVTAEEAAQRISAYLVMKPQYEYREDGVTITIDSFHRTLYFIMKSERPISKMDGGAWTEIGEHLYLIEANQDTVQISYQ